MLGASHGSPPKVIGKEETAAHQQYRSNVDLFKQTGTHDCQPKKEQWKGDAFHTALVLLQTAM